MKTIAQNRKAFYEYFILERIEAGIELLGGEVKSLRSGQISLAEGYAAVINEEAFLYNVHIAPYEKRGYVSSDPCRRRRLLLRKPEIRRLYGKTQQRGYTLIPLKVYFNEKGYAKVELGLCRGKKFYDKREEIKRRELGKEQISLRRIGRR